VYLDVLQVKDMVNENATGSNSLVGFDRIIFWLVI